MAQTSLDKALAANLAPMIQFEYDGESDFYTGWNEDVEVSGNTYVSEPTLEIDLNENHGGMEDKPHRFKMSRFVEPLATMVTGYLFAPVTVTLGHVDPGNPATTFRVLAVGKLSYLEKNPAGAQQICLGRVSGIKSLLKVKLGYFLTPSCQLPFPSCGATQEVVTGTVTSVRDSGTTTVQVSGTFSSFSDRRWRRGWVEVNGARAVIRNISSITGGAELTLTRQPPDRWIGEEIKVYSGCDKQPTTCREEYDNIENIVAPGISIPPYNPVLAQA